MAYAVKEIFATLQGEGAHSGRASVFCRFAGCNLWSGREADRAEAVCRFCDTDFVGGERFADAETLAEAIARCWRGGPAQRYVVITGGEPLLQVDAPLIEALHRRDFTIAVETNGTIEAPAGIDWICVSPKAGAAFRQRQGHELKLVFPQDALDPASFETCDFRHFFLQPMDGPDRARNTEATVAYCLAHPHWRLSVQTHKMIGIP
ncbi:7-carboxy-7-deazaguanine synthase [Lichenicoccus sp.]|uniref:7-carboxy-7-deazaguanine synthase n=1 Tax=Lichenicoccus sp. TaxID=2781899 RepID=UPI003D116734